MEEIWAIITNDVVTNVIVATQDFIGNNPAAVRIDNVTPQPGIAWTYKDGKFTAPPPPPHPGATGLGATGLGATGPGATGPGATGPGATGPA